MDLVKGIKERRSIRKFQDKPIDRKLIEEIVETARFAPSWKNTQIVRYLVVDDKEKIAAIANSKCTYGFDYNIKAIAGAPAVVILTFVEGRSGFDKDGSFSTPKGEGWQMFDAGVASEAFCLAAYEQGLGTVIMGIFDQQEAADLLEIPENQDLIALIPIGYPADALVAPKRKPVTDLLSYQQ